jgi:hypothetical protein
MVWFNVAREIAREFKQESQRSRRAKNTDSVEFLWPKLFGSYTKPL